MVDNIVGYISNNCLLLMVLRTQMYVALTVFPHEFLWWHCMVNILRNRAWTGFSYVFASRTEWLTSHTTETERFFRMSFSCRYVVL